MWCAHRFVGAALSTVDMVTDVQVIVEYLNTPGKEAYAYPLMGMVGTCLFFQLLLVFVQTRKGAKAKMVKEVLIVLSGLKPGFDAYQVAKGAEQSVGALVNPESELQFTKVFEMVTESIPGRCHHQLMLRMWSSSSLTSLRSTLQVASCSSTCS
jgi:hypothetical protein